MNDIPSMWRTELLHPQFVHFSVALLLTGGLLWLLSFLFSHQPRALLSNAGKLIIIVGTAISWGTVYTGSLADAEIVRNLCDPTVLEQHENNAYVVAYLFSGISLLLLVATFTNWLKNWSMAVNILVALLIVGGMGYLTYTSHLGAKIVYQQGGAVYHPSKDCAEFE